MYLSSKTESVFGIVESRTNVRVEICVLLSKQFLISGQIVSFWVRQHQAIVAGQITSYSFVWQLTDVSPVVYSGCCQNATNILFWKPGCVFVPIHSFQSIWTLEKMTAFPPLVENLVSHSYKQTSQRVVFMLVTWFWNVIERNAYLVCDWLRKGSHLDVTRETAPSKMSVNEVLIF